MKRRYLTKSKFKIAHECPTKLHYSDNKEFANANHSDAFLKALAEGGFQVGELAKIYSEPGIEIEERDHVKAVARTKELLQQKNVVIFEAALMFENCFVRVDILEKNGNSVRLLEVKAKSWIAGEKFTNKSGDKIGSDWEPYIADIAFQTFVAKKAFPEFRISSFLYLADKGAHASIDGLHQNFMLLSADDERTYVEVVPGTTKENVGVPVLKQVPVDQEVEMFLNQSFDGKDFESYISDLSKLAESGEFASPKISRACGACEFRVPANELDGKKSGFDKCWQAATKLSAKQLQEPLIFDIWNLHYMKKDNLIQDQRFLMSEVTKDDIDPEDETSIELTPKQRQWLQVERHQDKSKDPYFDLDHFDFRKKNEHWKAPFHFIDFETLTSAIPFNKGMRPYETLAFQFSHHIVDEKGGVTHHGQFINTKPGYFPNFDFVRALKKSLSNDEGTVFRYAAHENTVLNHIRQQLMDSDQPDRQELIQFIETLTVRKENKKVVHTGHRAMVDMCELVKRYYYSPLMGGSNSIKRVLPSVLQESEFLKRKYSKAVYGIKEDLTSLNYQGKAWVKIDADGKVEDPYSSLEPIFSDIDPMTLKQLDRVFGEDDIAEGGAASTAYARMQFTSMKSTERDLIEKALLRYCELDTLAMVMIWEYWTQELMLKTKRVA